MKPDPRFTRRAGFGLIASLAQIAVAGCGSTVDNTAKSCKHNEDCCSRGRGYWCKNYACEPARPELDDFPRALQSLIEACEKPPTCAEGLTGYVGCPCDTVTPGLSANVDPGGLTHEVCTSEEQCVVADLALAASYAKRACVFATMHATSARACHSCASAAGSASAQPKLMETRKCSPWYQTST